ncbi:MAG: glycerol-3-phosphate acyltransferase [Dehalococcoidia bacterium]|nr:glycerol-3-phosphate acyltransferase [Dehalococcoidia bacterium]
MPDIWLTSFANASVIASAYLIGSIPFGYIIVRLRTRKDLRNVGTGNVGAYNVLKQMGLAASVLVTLLDMGKGIVGFKIADWLDAPEGVTYACAAAVIIGHVYPVFLKYRGGTGVAPAIGIASVVAPLYTATASLGGLIVGLPRKSPPIGIFIGLLILNVLLIVDNHSHFNIHVILLVTLLVVVAHLLKKYRQVSSGQKRGGWREIC